MRPAFQEDELITTGYYSRVSPRMPGIPVLNSPVTTKENTLMMLQGEKPYWYPMVGMVGGDYKPLRPRMFPDLTVAHDNMDGEPPYPFEEGPDIREGWFDTQWRYVYTVGGPMIEPGTNKIESMNEWEQLTWPNLDDLDWEASAAANAAYIDCGLPVEFCMPTSYWERLMSILEVQNAAVALVDEDQQTALQEFLTKLTDLYVDLLHRVKHYYHPDMILIHDDWGHQNGQFFSNEVHEEVFMPHIKRFGRTVHELGMAFELHCCGKSEGLVPHMIEAGVNLWCPQKMNDIPRLAEKYRGQGITFGVEIPPIAPGMPGEDELADQTAQEFTALYKDGPVAYVNYGSSELLYKYMYRYSRDALR